MRTIVHLSDLHFGNVHDFLLKPLIEAVEEVRADLVILSGDFVEHATVKEFEDARAFLKLLPTPQLVIPGNHDLPFYDPLRRYREGLRHYRRYISKDLEAIHRDEEMLVIGLNTPRVLPIKGGRINQRQIQRVKSETCEVPSSVMKILVTHHPLDLPDRFAASALAGRAKLAVESLSTCVDLMIAGHIHLSSTGATAARYRRTGHSMIFAQAGTAISRRNKGEPNSFNVIRIESSAIEIEHRTWQEGKGAFGLRSRDHFERCSDGWCKIEGRRREQVEI